MWVELDNNQGFANLENCKKLYPYKNPNNASDPWKIVVSDLGTSVVLASPDYATYEEAQAALRDLIGGQNIANT